MSGRQEYLVELSGEHPNLPISEVLGALKGIRAEALDLLYEPRLLRFVSELEPADLASRLALARYVSVVHASGDLLAIRRACEAMDLEGRTFRLRIHDFTDRHDKPSLEAELGGLLTRTGTANLDQPQIDLRAVISHGVYLAEVMAAIDRTSFEMRRADRRPFFRPVSLHPRLARALVNLTGVSKGERLLDPFCGTGGILLEAGLIGARPIGCDVRADIVEGCRENLEAFGLKAELHVCDIGDVPEQVGQVDAVATDPPYGKAASTLGESLPELTDRSFKAITAVLKDGGRAAICLSRPEFLGLGKRYLRLVEWHALPVHRTLTRYFSVFQKV